MTRKPRPGAATVVETRGVADRATPSRHGLTAPFRPLMASVIAEGVVDGVPVRVVDVVPYEQVRGVLLAHKEGHPHLPRVTVLRGAKPDPTPPLGDAA